MTDRPDRKAYKRIKANVTNRRQIEIAGLADYFSRVPIKNLSRLSRLK